MINLQRGSGEKRKLNGGGASDAHGAKGQKVGLEEGCAGNREWESGEVRYLGHGDGTEMVRGDSLRKRASKQENGEMSGTQGENLRRKKSGEKKEKNSVDMIYKTDDIGHVAWTSSNDNPRGPENDFQKPQDGVSGKKT